MAGLNTRDEDVSVGAMVRRIELFSLDASCLEDVVQDEPFSAKTLSTTVSRRHSTLY